jgi:ABC-type phosphate/phosphonate transport system substrate-binding protein
MKINPKLKLNVVFWTITIPAIPFVILLTLLALLVSPVTNRMIDVTEKVVTKFARWRNNLPVVKNAYDKAHLFDYIKG